MSAFEPLPTLAICSRTLPAGDQAAFKKKWRSTSDNRVMGWKKARKTQSQFEPQLKFNGECTMYVDATAERVRPLKGSTEWRALPLGWPLYGPDFYPPTFAHYQMRNAVSECNPEWAYIKRVKTLHPIYYPFLSRCPNCRGTNVQPNGWTATGHREVHGLYFEEVVIGVQLRCIDCAGKHKAGELGDNEKYCYSTTNAEFWDKLALWEIPRGVPHFFHRCAVTSELFDFIVECRLAENSAAIAEHVKQFHLLEYHRARYEYLQFFEARSKQTGFAKTPELRNFSEPQRVGKALHGYDGTSITDDLVADVYARFSEQRRKECDEHLRTLTATTLSLDATFRAAAKASFVNDDRSRASIFNGGLHTAVNQKALIIAYRWCLTLLHSEIGDMLQGMKRRFELLNVDNPWAVIVDNCCHFRSMILDVYPDAVVLQDVWHVIMRYVVCILGGSKNPHQRSVGEDISGALIKTKAKDGVPAHYWSREEQEERLEAAYMKWVAVGGVWSAAAANTHRQQIDHVRKGCLARPREDVATDGSRIEGTHKGWNALQRTHPSGVKVLTDLAADHVIRHNIRVDSTHTSPYAFTKSTFGSHHVYLVNACARRWNALLQPGSRGKRPPADLSVAPTLEPANSDESFGLVRANAEVAAYHTFVMPKDEPEDSLIDLSSQDPEFAERVAASLGVDPTLLFRPLAPGPSLTCSRRAISHLSPASSSFPAPIATDVAAASAPQTCDSSPPTTPASESTHAPSALPIDVDTIPNDTPLEAVPLRARGGPKKRQASTTLSRAQQERVDSADPTIDISKKRPRSTQPDAPSSSSSSVNHPPNNSKPGPSSSSSSGQAPSQASSILGHLPAFFSQCRLGQTPEPTTTSLICLPTPTITGRTRSQRIISAATGFDASSLTFPQNDDVEFFPFMDLRAKYKWATYNMTAAMWVEAASVYNTALEDKKGEDAARKTPRALMEKLEAIEATIHERNKNKYYISKHGLTDFWERHCNAVNLVQGKASKGKGKVTQQALSTRKPHTCHRCLSTMWAGGEGGRENHKKGYCSDGVKQKATAVDGVTEDLPLWPQPSGIFTKGNTFWPKHFTRAVRELYDNVVVGHEFSGVKAMEYMAFADMLRTRLIVIPPTETEPSTVRFKLYRGLTLGEQPEQPSDLVTVNGVGYLHVSYLSEDGFQEVEGLATTI